MYAHSKLTRSSRLSDTIRNCALYAGLAVAASTHAAPVFAGTPSGAPPNFQDMVNEYDYPPLDPATHTYGPNGLVYVFGGNVCPNIPAQYVWDDGVDPFDALEEYETAVGGPVVTPTFTCTYDSNNNETYAEWAGGTLPVPLPQHTSPPQPPGWPIVLHQDSSGNLDVHSGLLEGTPSLTGIKPIWKEWIWTQTSPAQSTVILFTGVIKPVTGIEKHPQYAAVFLKAVSAAMPETGTWYLVDYDGKSEFTLSNNSPDTITFPPGESGIVAGINGPTAEQCEETPNCYEALLDQLNDQDYPEPGMAGSPFKPLKLPSQLAPGQTYTIKAPR